MSRGLTYLFAVLCVGALWCSDAQAQVKSTEAITDLYQDDFQMWASASITYKYSKELRFFSELGQRRDDNAQALRYNYFDLGGTYRFNKYLRFSSSYRLRFQETQNKSRITANLGVRVAKIERFKIDYRMRFQNQSDVDADPAKILRHRARVKYNAPSSPLNPYVSAELYYEFMPLNGGFNAFRTVGGVSWSLPFGGEVDIFLLREKEFNVVRPARIMVIGLGYSYTMKR